MMPQQRPIGPAEYQDLVSRVHSVVRTSIPPGAVVLIVSKGDDRLVDLGSWRGWHFPQDRNGRYPGYYPSDSDEAIRHLEELRDRGGDFLLIPSTSFWWLDHYRELAQHLMSHYQMVVRLEDTCLIYALRDPAENRLASFLGSLLPDDAEVAIVTGGDASLLAVDRMASHFPRDAGGTWDGDRYPTGAAAVAALEDVREDGVRFLAVPVEASEWLERHPDFLAQARARYRQVAEREHLCTLFDLDRPASGARAQAEGPTARGGRRGARTGVVAKLVGMLPWGGEAGSRSP